MANTLSIIFLSSFFLICLVAKEVTSCSQEDYWRMKLPNVPIPNPISNNLFHSISDGKVKANNLNQPYTVFSWKYKDNKDKYNVANNQPNVEDNKDQEAAIDQPYTVFSWKYKADNKEKATVAKPNEENGDEKATVAQPYTVFSWKYKADNKEKAIVAQPNEENGEEKATVSQPYTVFSWKYKSDNKEKATVTQPNEENGEEKATVAQPYTVFSWKYKSDNKEKATVAQPKEENGDEKTMIDQPYTVYSWKYKADNKEKTTVTQPREENGEEKATVAQPYTVYSWKYKADNKEKATVTQPKEEIGEKTAQPYTVYSWKYKEGNQEKDVKDKSVNNHQSNSHLMHHLNAGEDKDMVAGSVFFIEENLKLGKKLRHDFQKSPKANFLSRDVASSIPFAVDKYTEILDRLSIHPNSAEATSIKETLSLCLERPHVKKENRTCVQSMEELVDFVIEELGTNNVKVATMSTSEDKVPTGMQDYWIAKLNKLEIPNKDGVACHKMVYPYAVYWCHHQQDIGQYAVTLVNSDGVTVDTTAVCHYDTYAWEPEVPALRYLGIRPGDANVCHFAAINDMFWSLNGKITDGTSTLKLPNGDFAQ